MKFIALIYLEAENMQYRLGLLAAAGVIAVGLQAEAQDRWAGLYAGLSLDRSKSDVAAIAGLKARFY